MSEIEFHSAQVDCEWIESGSFLKESGGTIDLQEVLRPVFADGDTFFPKAVYVREEMCLVFAELIKSDRKRKQILIGSPGVGKSVLLFLVAMYRTLKENKPGCFIRKTRDTEELTSVFFFKRKFDNSTIMEIHYNREVHPDTKVTTVLELTLQQHQHIERKRALPAVLKDDVILYINDFTKATQISIFPTITSALLVDMTHLLENLPGMHLWSSCLAGRKTPWERRCNRRRRIF